MSRGESPQNKLKLLLLTLLLAVLTTVPAGRAHAELEPFIGEVMCGGWNFCPDGWMDCSGQLLNINQYQALFALIGTTYGGNGSTTFALPNIQGRTMVHQGQGPGLNNRALGETGGAASVSLSAAQLPAHSHLVTAASGTGSAATPASRVPAAAPAADAHFSASAPDRQMAAPLGSAGSSQAHNNLQPYTVMKCCIAVTGLFPARQ